MNELDIYEGSVTHQVGSVILENHAEGGRANPALSTFIHAVVDGRWMFVGAIWRIDEWVYYIPEHMTGGGKNVVPCGSAVEGINTVLRLSGAIS